MRRAPVTCGCGTGTAGVTFVELFFDLVFVFAVTQLSHGLLEHLTPLGALQTAILMLALWWAWIDNAWLTNWLDPERAPVRILLFALMLLGLVVSASIPKAFAERALPFALAYAALEILPKLFMLWALKHHDPGNHRNFVRITVWRALGAACWLAGGFAAGTGAPCRCGGSRSRSTPRRPCSASGCRGSAAPPPPTGTSRAPTWPSAAACSSSSRSANRS